MTQKLFIFASVLLLGSLAANADWMSRYWDGCKPSCSWSGKPTASGMGLCKNCDKSDKLIATNDQTASSCDGGPAYTCWDMSPVAVDNNLAYGFVASNPSKMNCGSCYELTFTGEGQHGTGPSHQALVGKKMIVMASNIGGDVANDQFDLLVPGGGVGMFDAFSSQIGKSKSELGAQYGGLLSDCANHNNASVATNQSCLKTKCASVFSGQAKLKAGCDFYADWLMAANNPKFTSRSITCPDYLVTAYKQAAGNPPGGGNSSSSSGGNPPVTNHTIQVARNQSAYGSVSVKIGNGNAQTNPSGQLTASANTSITIAATPSGGYSFQNWTAVSGSLPSGINANSQSITFNISSNVNIRANFQSSSSSSSSGGNPPVATYTLQVARNQSAGGNVAVTVSGNTQNNPQNSQTLNSGTSVTLSATANSGYNFQNWTAVSGSLPSGINASNQSIIFNISSNVNIRANFQQTGGGVLPPGTYSLLVGREPEEGGNVSVDNGPNNPGQSTHNEWAYIEVKATPSSGYTFENWEVLSGTLPSWVNTTALNMGFNINSQTGSVSIIAHFKSSGGVINPPIGTPGGDGNRTDTIKVEAEDYESKVGDNMVTSTNNDGITNIGYIENGYSATYNVGVARAGARTMVFRIASNYDQGSSEFKVIVNGSEAGTITGHTNDWDGYTYITLNADVPFNAGQNTIKLEFHSPVNVDHFLLLGEEEVSPPITSIKPPVVIPQPKYSNGAHITANGIHLQVMNNARLELFDLRGKSVKRMNFSNGAHPVQLNDLPKGLYLAKISFGSERRILRVPIR